MVKLIWSCSSKDISSLEKKEMFDVKLIEIDSCIENEVIEMLEKWNLFNQLTYKKLHRMGWRGKIKKDAIIINIKHPN